MPEIITEAVSLGVSACLDRCPVRYNGRALDELEVLGREAADFRLTPVCPECMAGMGVPRVPIHLTGNGDEVLAGTAAVKDGRGRDRTPELLAGCDACIGALRRAGVEAVVLKEKSPSCGLFLTPTGAHRDRPVTGAGVFGAMVLREGWFSIPSTALNNPLAWWDWRRRLHAWLWLKRRPITGAKDLYDAWHTLKFVVQETQRAEADAIGRALAALPRHPAAEEIAALCARMSEALVAPTTPARARTALWKAYSHATKKGELAGVDLHGLDVRPPGDLRSATRIAREMTGLERISFENDLLVGTSPVLRRDARRVAARKRRIVDAGQSSR
jgi:uncharacterized protein YbbK (DUF523 family)